MTPDELPADMEAVVSERLAEIDASDAGSPCRQAYFSPATIRALLKAYQEQRRALEPFAKAAALFDTGDYVNHDACIYRPAAGDEYFLSSGHLLAARAALTGEDTATLGLSGKTQTDARTRGDA
jgi:hypothetical protein